MFKIKVSESSERIFWSIAFPGFGQILNKHIFKGVLFIFLEFLINIKSNLNLILMYSFLGNTESAVSAANYKWLMFYPCIYMFAMWDSYKNSEGHKLDFIYLPFAFAAIFSTIGVIFSPSVRVFGFLLGPAWLPILSILLGIVTGLVIRKPLIGFLKQTNVSVKSQLHSYDEDKVETRFEERYSYIEQLCKSELVGIAVYSVPDLVLLKANQTYLNFLESPFNESCNSIGKRIDEIVIDWKGSEVERYWKEAIDAGRSFRVSEHMHKLYSRGITYWDSIITPVMENGLAKYVVSNAKDVTEIVMSRKKVEEQMEVISSKNKQLEAIIESAGDILMIMDKEGKVIKHSGAYNEIYNKSNNHTVQFYDFHNNPISVKDEPICKVLKNGEEVKDFKMKKMEDGKVTYTVTNGVPVFNSKKEVEFGVFTTVVVKELDGKRISS